MISYTLLDPTGNLTILAETPVPAASQPLIGGKLMELEPQAEQVGFVQHTEDGIRLRMAGGEFCGNASMSAAALFLHRAGLTGGTVSVYVSGRQEPVPAVMTAYPDGKWQGTVRMPAPLSVSTVALSGSTEYPVVRFPGISHVILQETMDPVHAEALAPVWCRKLNADALGLMFLDPGGQRLRPLVYVPAADTLFWESSCASGTTAAGAFLAEKYGHPVRLSLTQPGGTLTISAVPDGELLLTGTVRILHSTYADIPVPPQ